MASGSSGRIVAFSLQFSLFLLLAATGIIARQKQGDTRFYQKIGVENEQQEFKAVCRILHEVSGVELIHGEI